MASTLVPRPLLALIAGLVAARGTAEEVVAGGGEVAVVQVRFGTVPAEAGRWFETAIEVAVRPAAENRSRFVSRVRVDLELGYERPGGNAFEFYRAQATAVALEQGRAQFRFYLPPEIVERDRVTGDLRYYHIGLSVDGHSRPLAPAQVGPGLTSPEALANFRSRVAAAAPRTDGMLFPQHETPMTGRAGPPAPTMLRSP